MPLQYGTDLATAVQSLLPGTRVLFMSGYTDNSVVRQGLLSANTAFIQKPFTAPDLDRKVREVLSS